MAGSSAAAPNMRSAGSPGYSGRANIASPTTAARTTLRFASSGLAARSERTTHSIALIPTCRPSRPNSSIASILISHNRSESPGFGRGFFVGICHKLFGLGCAEGSRTDQCPLLALSGHAWVHCTCLLLTQRGHFHGSTGLAMLLSAMTRLKQRSPRIAERHCGPRFSGLRSQIFGPTFPASA